MKTKEVARKILENIGGSNNINTFTHCATRLRFDIKDDSIIKKEELNSMKEVLGVVDKNGQFQVVIGPAVESVYKDLVPLLQNVAVERPAVDDKMAAEEDNMKKQSVFSRVMSYVSGAIQPTLPVLIGAGMINAVLAIAVLLGLDKEGGTYIAWAAVANIGFAYLPVFVAYSAARKLGTNEYIAAFLSLAMIVSFNQQEAMSMLGIGIPNIKFANAIIPSLLMVPVLYQVDRLWTEIIPAAFHFTLKPLFMVIIMVPLILFVFGPAGALIGSGLAYMCIWLMDTIGSVAMAVLAALHPITVMFGMQYLFTPVMVNEVAESGYSFVLDRALAANFAMAGAALAVGVKAKKNENKSVGFSSCVTALLSVTEPALYGCLIRLRKPLISACAAAGVSGMFLGIFQVKAYAIASPTLLSLPIFIGGESMMNLFLACAGAAIGFGLGFIFTYVVGFKEE
ncbi:PTS transporter subunit EIIC [Lachnospiraceae bacterium 54-53]